MISGLDLKRLTRGFLKPRAHALLFDTSINTVHHVKFNIYEIGVLAGIKFHAHVQRMEQHTNAVFFASIVLDASKYMWWLVEDRTNKFLPLCQCHLREQEVENIIITSFIHVLSRKRNFYKNLLILLNKEMDKRNGKERMLRGERRAVLPRRSNMLVRETGIMF